MTCNFYIVSLFLTMTAFLIPEPGTADINTEINFKNCPLPKRGECYWGVKSDTPYTSIISKEFGVNFLCDTQTDGGGWIIIQRRVNQDTLFNQTWRTYKNGFGQVCNDYWLGNNYIHQITMTGKYELRIDMIYKHTQHFAHYKHFSVDNEESNYKLHVGGFLNGSVGDDLTSHDGQQFSTRDRDNDAHSAGSCAVSYDSGWWYSSCHRTNLNGHFDGTGKFGKAVIWESLTGDLATLEAVEMKIRIRDD